MRNKTFLILKYAFACVCIILTPFGLFISWEIFAATKKITPTVAMVLGAGIINNELPTKVLERRLDKAIKLYKDNNITKILVSGDNSSVSHNEPEVMQNYLIKKGIAEKNIIQDFGGRRTIDSCWRAKNVFKIQSLYLITQEFHLPRATFLCEQQGLSAIPIIADDSSFAVKINGYIREIPASWVALWESYTKYEPEIKGNGSEQSVISP